MERKYVKSYILLISYAILLYMALQHIPLIRGFFGNAFSLFVPFICGSIIAYSLVRPINFLMKRVYRFSDNPKGNGLSKLCSLLTVYVIAIGVVIVVVALVVPQILQSISSIVQDLPNHYDALQNFFNRLINDLHLSEDFWVSLQQWINQIFTTSMQFLYNALPNLLGSVVSITSSITNFLFGIIISVYILSNKETLCRQAKQLTYAFLPEKGADHLLNLVHLTDRTFSQFINGQLLDALILGTLCFIGMTIFRFPYAVLISVIIGSSNIIPIFGPILGTVPTTIIIFMSDPKIGRAHV